LLRYYLIASPIVLIVGALAFLSLERVPSDKKIIIDLDLGNEEKK